MAQQVAIDRAACTGTETEQGVQEVTRDLAYQRLAIVNVAYYGLPDAGDRGWVLIDAGVVGMADFITRAAESRFGRDARPAAIVLTHGHFDHIGTLEELADRWDAPIYAHELEFPYLDGRSSYPPPEPTVGGGLMAALSRFYPRGPIDVSPRLQPLPDDQGVPSMPGWRWIHTPGHTPGHVSLWRETDRAIVAGDAFITTAQESAYAVVTQRPELHGPPKYYTADWEQARESVHLLAELEPEVAMTGHGPALRGATVRTALHELASNFERLAVPEPGR